MNINLKGITKNFGQTSVFQDFSVSFKKGEISCILGHSGSGKTTLLNILSGLTDYQGSIENLGGNISYIFQEECLIKSLTAYKNIEYVLLRLIKDKKQREEIITNVLKTAELYDKKDKYPNELSGGMRQRLSMARAFVYPSEIMLMDEPFRSLDIALKNRIIQAFLKLWQKDKKTTVFVTHDIDEAMLISDTIYILKDFPAQIKHKFEIEKHSFERDITDSYFTDMRKKLYNIMTEG